MHAYHEPLDQWVVALDTGETVDLLAMFYQNPTRRAFAFQCAAFTTRMQQYIGALRNGSCNHTLLAERSIETDRVFATMLAKEGTFDPVEFKIYCRFYDFFLGVFPNFTPRGMVYLRTSTEVCYRRIQQRQRCGEIQDDGSETKGVSHDYLHKLDVEHELLMARMKEKGVKVLELDGDVSAVTFRHDYVTQVLQFMREVVKDDTQRIVDYFTTVCELSPMSTADESPFAVVEKMDRGNASPVSPWFADHQNVFGMDT